MIIACDCFRFATLELVRSTPIKQRLISAYRRHLALVPVEQIPPEIQESFEHVMSCLCGVKPLRGEDAVAASVRKMSNQEADDCAAQIVDIFGQICRAQASSARPAAAPVKLHSVEMQSDEFDIPALIASR
jgi:hypothetical protein